jgi:hypothetical protein
MQLSLKQMLNNRRMGCSGDQFAGGKAVSKRDKGRQIE